MKTQINFRLLIPALALLLVGAAFIGYQVVSAQTSQEELGEDPPSAPTGLTATHDGVGVMLEWDDPDDDSIAGYQIWRRYHRDSHEDADRAPVDDELQLHVRHTGNPDNHFHDSDFVEHETVYGYAVSALGSDGSEGVLSEEVTITTPDAPGEAPEEIDGVELEVVEGDVKITWSSLNDDTITDFHISRTSEDHPDGGNWIHLTNAHHATTEFLDFHGLETGKTYVYTISAQNEHGIGPHSDPARITVVGKPSLDETPTPSGDAPSAPTGVSAGAVFDGGGHKIVVTWDTHPSDQGVTDWIITRWDPDSGVNLGHTRIGGLDHTHVRHEELDVAPSTTYAYTVHAANQHGHGPYSQRVTATTGSQQTAPPPEPTPTPVGQ